MNASVLFLRVSHCIETPYSTPIFMCFFDRVKEFLASFTCRNDLVSHPVAEGAWVILEISQSDPTMLTKFKVIPCYYFIQNLKKNIIN